MIKHQLITSMICGVCGDTAQRVVEGKSRVTEALDRLPAGWMNDDSQGHMCPDCVSAGRAAAAAAWAARRTARAVS